MIATYWFQKEKKQIFLKTLSNFLVPSRFSFDWSNVVKEYSMGLKNMITIF